MVTEMISPVNYNPGRSKKLIKLGISSCRCSQLECNDKCDETEGYSALYTPLLPLRSLFCLFLNSCLRQVLLYYFYRKSPDEAFASFKREESDSSVIDPETEGNKQV